MLENAEGTQALFPSGAGCTRCSCWRRTQKLQTQRLAKLHDNALRIKLPPHLQWGTWANFSGMHWLSGVCPGAIGALNFCSRRRRTDEAKILDAWLCKLQPSLPDEEQDSNSDEEADAKPPGSQAPRSLRFCAGGAACAALG